MYSVCVDVVRHSTPAATLAADADDALAASVLAADADGAAATLTDDADDALAADAPCVLAAAADFLELRAANQEGLALPIRAC